VSGEKQIIAAFLSLLKQQKYADISISDVMTQAQMTRTYFYQFFDNKSDLVREAFFSYIAKILESFSKAFLNSGQIDHQSTYEAVNYMLDHKDDMLFLISIQSANFNFQSEFQDRIKKLVKQQIITQTRQSNQKIDYFVEIFSSSAMTTINWFLHQDNVEAQTVVEFIETCISKGLMSILK
jgi:Transcriptional regulator